MDIRVFQKGFHYAQDGPGNRLVYHLQGCNLRCPWCANPEGMPLEPPILQQAAPLPEFLCPHGAIADGKLDRTLCRDCAGRDCVCVHRNTLLTCACVTYDVEELAAEALRARPLFFDGGGVTITGGEATVQFAAVLELLRRLRTGGVHTALETNATHPRLGELLPQLDLLIADLKHYDSETHRRFTGLGNEAVLSNLRLAAREARELWIRVPLVGGFNADPADIPGFAAALRDIAKEGGRIRVECLRYHEYGRDKWAQCGLSYAMDARTAAVDAETAAAFEAAFAAAGLAVLRT